MGRLRPDAVCALLFPGTGSAGAPDLVTLAARGPGPARVVGDVVDAVQEALPRERWPSLRRILLEDPDTYREAARLPGVAQLAAYTASVAVDRVLRAAGVMPRFAVGQSFGEIAALVCAGAFSVTDGARMAADLVGVLARRGGGGGMGLLEADEAATLKCIARAEAEGAGAGRVVVACLNAPSATVVSGPDAELDRVLAVARESGVRAARLAVPYLSHHPAMAGADDEWYAMIRPMRQRPLEVTVHSPVRGRVYGDDDDLHRALADCIVKPVRLPATLRAVHRAGATVFVEGGAGGALCQCARMTVRDVATVTPLRDRRRTAPPGGATAAPPPLAGRDAASEVGKASPEVSKSSPEVTAPDEEPSDVPS
ncbi:ACP S-malonyltransferase [Actinomadura namibiensis]|uniref:[acyl-carrier-protein] S-malonyltransferase n=1 Tax=Actinomadura namibiensis TaxID=182080 RepID=A0A7W3LSD7_ACTNM|nr:acyltransferase domain-containing protein [Actinomadura namibiensis]MBA8953327.1 [acyl-carrier-protein] S-malonyltransferase [Actinomadura namibiensis]